MFSGVLKLGGIINAEVDLVILLLDVSEGSSNISEKSCIIVEKSWSFKESPALTLKHSEVQDRSWMHKLFIIHVLAKSQKSYVAVKKCRFGFSS